MITAGKLLSKTEEYPSLKFGFNIEMNFYNKVGEHPLIGKRIRLSFSSDTELNEGELGTITDINESEFTQIGVKWDNGSKLTLIQDVDIFETLD